MYRFFRKPKLLPILRQWTERQKTSMPIGNLIQPPMQIIQVIKFPSESHPDIEIELSDSQYTIKAVFTQSCLESLIKRTNVSLGELRGTLVYLLEYVVRVDPNSFTLVVTKANLVAGSSGSGIVKEPIDLMNSAEARRLHTELRQYEESLENTDPSALFAIADALSQEGKKRDAITLRDCLISHSQEDVLAALPGWVSYHPRVCATDDFSQYSAAPVAVPTSVPPGSLSQLQEEPLSFQHEEEFVTNALPLIQRDPLPPIDVSADPVLAILENLNKDPPAVPENESRNASPDRITLKTPPQPEVVPEVKPPTPPQEQPATCNPSPEPIPPAQELMPSEQGSSLDNGENNAPSATLQPDSSNETLLTQATPLRGTMNADSELDGDTELPDPYTQDPRAEVLDDSLGRQSPSKSSESSHYHTQVSMLDTNAVNLADRLAQTMKAPPPRVSVTTKVSPDHFTSIPSDEGEEELSSPALLPFPTTSQQQESSAVSSASSSSGTTTSASAERLATQVSATKTNGRSFTLLPVEDTPPASTPPSNKRKLQPTTPKDKRKVVAKRRRVSSNISPVELVAEFYRSKAMEMPIDVDYRLWAQPLLKSKGIHITDAWR